MIKKFLINLGLLSTITLGGAVVVDVGVVSDSELQASIKESVLAGKEPVVDISKVAPERIIPAYVAVIESMGGKVDVAKDANLYVKVRETAVKQGIKVEPSVNSKSEAKTVQEYQTP